MTDEMVEIIRVLQLTTYDEDEWDADNLSVMRKALSAIQSLLQVRLMLSCGLACCFWPRTSLRQVQTSA